MARSKKSNSDAVLLELREFGLAYPGAHTKSPWPGHMDLAVKGKTFAYLSIDRRELPCPGAEETRRGAAAAHYVVAHARPP